MRRAGGRRCDVAPRVANCEARLDNRPRATVSRAAPDEGKAMNNLRVDGPRLWDSLMEMARIGATAKGGVCRLALSDLDKQSRDLLVRWCEAAGCTVTVDRVGNIFARRPGSDPARPAVM